MESLSGKPFEMVVQTGKNWVSDNIALFFWGISFWCFLSNSLMWPLFVLISNISNQGIPDF